MRTSSKQKIYLLQKFAIGAIFLCLAPAASVAKLESPNTIVQEAVDLLTVGLENRHEELSTDEEALYAFIDGILTPRFEREFAARKVLGKHWKTASEEQQSRFMDAFYVTLLRKYSKGILEFDMSRVKIRPFRGKLDRRYATVKTDVRLDDGTKVAVFYDLVKKKDDWRMYNVKVEGVSYVRNFFAEFNEEIKLTSLAAVIERLESEVGAGADEADTAGDDADTVADEADTDAEEAGSVADE